ncbi:MAG: ABC transporter permease subunit [Firmicutes bacterium]|nr:ABC transporter permease subunit [Bacillota bacterium]
MKSLRAFWKQNYKIILVVFGIVFVVAMWWFLSWIVHSALIPSPIYTFANLGILLSESATYENLFGSLSRLIVGFGLSFIVGSLLGIVAGVYKKLQYFLKPLMMTLRTLPTAAVMLIFLALFRFSNAPYYIVFLVVFPISYESMVAGINHIDDGIRDSLKIEGEKKLKSIMRVRVPLTAPYVVLGIFQSLGLGMKVEIMSEILAGDGRMHGIGTAIKLAYDAPKYVDMYGYGILAIILIALIELALYFAKKLVNNK